MEKVICDVCGTDYPETAPQCPICGCARGDGCQTSAGNTAVCGEQRPYTYTKGGRFSKSNVRKRLKAQMQNTPVVKPVPQPDYDDYDDEDDEDLEEPASNGGLIVIVILLLVAIIVFSSYIAIVHFDLLGGDEPVGPVSTTGSAQTIPQDSTVGGIQVPCTGLTVTDSAITLMAKDSVWQLSFAVDPLDTTDQIKFQSSDESVATVDSTGRVTAVGSGEATITVICGSFASECTVKCDFDGTEPPDDPVDPIDPVDPVVELKLRKSDVTLDAKGYVWNAYSGDIDPADITWTSDDESIATVSDGKVTAVGIGNTVIYAEYEGQKVSCIIRCKWKEETQPENPTDPSEPSEPSEPSDEPTEVYFMKVNNLDPYYVTGTDACEVSIKVGEAFLLSIVNEMEARMDVEWTMSKDGIVTMDGRKVVGAATGKVTLTASYGEQTFTCVIIVNA